jgi:hypothetical protein
VGASRVSLPDWLCLSCWVANAGARLEPDEGGLSVKHVVDDVLCSLKLHCFRVVAGLTNNGSEGDVFASLAVKGHCLVIVGDCFHCVSLSLWLAYVYQYTHKTENTTPIRKLFLFVINPLSFVT